MRLKLELVGGDKWSAYTAIGGLVVLRSNYTERVALASLREKLDSTLLVEF